MSASLAYACTLSHIGNRMKTTARPARRSRARAARPARRSASAPALDGLLDDQPRAGDRRGVALGRPPAGGPGSASSRLATTTVGTRERGELARAARTGASAARLRARRRPRAGARGRRGAGAAPSRPSPARPRARRRGHTRARSPPPRPRAARARARPSAPARAAFARRVGVEGRRDQRERRRRARACDSARRSAVCAPIDAPASTARCEPQRVEHRREVLGELLVAVGARLRAPARSARGRARRRRSRDARSAPARASPSRRSGASP